MSFKICLLLSFILSVYSRPPLTNKGDLDSKQGCCLDHKKKSSNGGGICVWNKNDKCSKFHSKKCNRIPYYTIHNGIKIDTGLCSGLCEKDNECEPSLMSYLSIDSDGEISSVPENMIDNVP